MKKILVLVAVILTSIITANAIEANQNSVIKYKADEKLDIIESSFNRPIISHTFNKTSKEGIITFKGSLTKISREAFYGVAEWLSLPESLLDISEVPFGDCYVEEFRGKFAAMKGRCLIVNGKLLKCTEIKEGKDFTIPNGITRICQDAFMYNHFASITIPASVTEIHGSAFNNACGKLIMLSSKAPKIYGGPLHDTEGTDRAVFTTKVFVPKGAAANYKNAPYWRDNKNLIFEY